MFKELINDAKITFTLKPKTPLRIHSGTIMLPNAALPDSQLVRSRVNGVSTVIIPGSSLKGVFRSHCERILKTIDNNFYCDIFDDTEKEDKNLLSCKSAKADDKAISKGQSVYNKICNICKMYGSTAIGGRVLFKDSYPTRKKNGELNLDIGIRNGVKIDRITGGASGGGLYSFEVVEDGQFKVEIMLKNYELYQLVLLLYTIIDLNDGYVTIGAGSTRGFGEVNISEIGLTFRDYKGNDKIKDIYGNCLNIAIKLVKKDYFYEVSCDEIDINFIKNLLSNCNLIELLKHSKTT